MASSDQRNSSYVVGVVLVFLVVILFGVWIILKAPWLERPDHTTASPGTDPGKTEERAADRTDETAEKRGGADEREQTDGGGDTKNGAGSPSETQTDKSGPKAKEKRDTSKATSKPVKKKGTDREPTAGSESKSDADQPDATDKKSDGGDLKKKRDGDAEPAADPEAETSEREDTGSRAPSGTEKKNETTDAGRSADETEGKTGPEVAKARRKSEESSDPLSPELRSMRKQARQLYEENHYSRAIEQLKTVRKQAGAAKKKEIDAMLTSWKKSYRQKKKLGEIWFRKAREARDNKEWNQVLDYTSKALSHLPHSQKYSSLKDKARRMKRFEGMVRVSGDSYTVGSDSVDGHPERSVEVDAFYMDRQEVTNRKYAAFLEQTDHRAPLAWEGRTPPAGEGNHPVTGVSFRDARAYAKWAGKRLPTEVEWEVAARGAGARLYPWGASADGLPANTVENGEKDTIPVSNMSEGATPDGFQHMVGNVAEWTTTKGQSGDGGTYRIVKGGSFLYPLEKSRPANRLLRRPQARLLGIGFRCVLDAPEKNSGSSSEQEAEKGE